VIFIVLIPLLVYPIFLLLFFLFTNIFEKLLSRFLDDTYLVTKYIAITIIIMTYPVHFHSGAALSVSTTIPIGFWFFTLWQDGLSNIGMINFFIPFHDENTKLDYWTFGVISLIFQLLWGFIVVKQVKKIKNNKRRLG